MIGNLSSQMCCCANLIIALFVSESTVDVRMSPMNARMNDETSFIYPYDIGLYTWLNSISMQMNFKQ